MELPVTPPEDLIYAGVGFRDLVSGLNQALRFADTAANDQLSAHPKSRNSVTLGL